MPLHVPPPKSQPDEVAITRADATAAGTLYDQAQANSVVNLANDTKAKVNATLAKLRSAGILK